MSVRARNLFLRADLSSAHKNIPFGVRIEKDKFNCRLILTIIKRDVGDGRAGYLCSHCVERVLRSCVVAAIKVDAGERERWLPL